MKENGNKSHCIFQSVEHHKKWLAVVQHQEQGSTMPPYFHLPRNTINMDHIDH